jgi:hypothetical protein
MLDKPLESVTLTEIQSLMDDAVPEGKTLEYKRDIPGQSQEDKKKLLRAICALANTAGGDLIYGIEEASGIPTGIPGIECADEDSLRLRFESSCREGIQPRLAQLHFRFIAVGTGRSVLIVRVKKSWNAPHRLGQDGHFYARNSSGTYQLDVGELRQVFALSESTIDRIRAFRTDRLIKIEDDAGPVSVVDGVKMVFHMIPFSAFASIPPQRIELTDSQRTTLDPIGQGGSSGGVNLDGYFRYVRTSNDQAKSYTQLFRSGVVECVASFSSIQNVSDRPVPSVFIETQLIRLTNAYRHTLSSAGVGSPFLFFLSFLGVHGSVLIAGGGPFSESATVTQRKTDALILPEIIAETDGFDAAQTLKPLFDSYWNAYGYEGSQNYDKSGKWIQRN